MNRKIINMIIAKVILEIITNSVCCMNCEYYFATIDLGICTIDKEVIDVDISHIAKCQAFNTWFGVVD